jgi:hypothetical protein
MKKYGRKMMGIFTAAAMTTAVFAGNVAVSADDGAVEAIQEGLMNTFSGIDQIFDMDLSEFENAEQATVDYSISGMVPSEDGAMEFKADLESVMDLDEGALSFEGNISAMGMDIPFVMCMDDSHIVVELPGILDQAVSYDFSSDEAEGFLAEMLGEEGIAMINEQLRSIIPTMEMQRDMSTSTKGKFKEIANEFLQTHEFTGPEEGDLDGVAVEGYSTVITAEHLSDLWDKLKEVEITTSMNVEEYLNQVLATQSMSGESGFISSAAELEEALASAPEIGLAFWLADNTCRALDVTVDEDTLHMVFNGEEEPWRSISIQDGENEVASVETVDDGGVETLTMAVSGEEQFTLTYDKTSGDFALALPEATGLGEITGRCYMEDGDLVITVDFMGFNLELTEKIGGEVAEPEGEVLELNTASSETVQELMGSLMSLMGAVEVEDTASSAA